MSDDKLDKILRSFTKLESNVNAKFSDLETRIVKVQQQVDTALTSSTLGAGEHDSEHGDRPSEGQTHMSAVGQPQVQPQGFHQVDTDSLQRHFKVVKDSYSSVRIPDDLYYTGRQQGIDNKSKDAVNILSSVAKYTEVALKVIGHLSQNEETPSTEVNDLMICLVSQMRYIQERHAGLVVAGTYGSRAKKLFDSMGGSTSSFAHPQILQRVETAAKLALYQPNLDDRTTLERQPFRRGRGPWRGWGGFCGSFQGRGGDFQPYNNNNQFPQDRDRDDAQN